MDAPSAIDPIVLRGLARKPEDRWPSAAAMETALASALAAAPRREVGACVERLAGPLIGRRRALLRASPREDARSQDHDLPSAPDATVAAVLGPPAPAAAAPAEEPRPARRRLAPRILAAVATLALVSAGAFALGVGGGSVRGAQRKDAPPPVARAIDAPSADSSTASPADPHPSLASDAAVVAPRPSSVTEHPPALEARGASAKRGATAPVSTLRPKPRKHCEPPYTIDATGVRVPKPECL